MVWETKSEARQKLAREEGTIVKDWGGRIPVALVYPNTYHVGMSNLGVQTIYGLLNADDRIVCERAFWEGQTMNGDGAPVLSIESQRELTEFAVVAFSVTFELDYFNIIAALRRAKIPVLAAERDSRHPLLIAGGPCIIENPEPLAPFFDAFAIGEGEVIVPHLIEALDASAEENDRENFLRKLARIPGIYVPSLYEAHYDPDGTLAQIVPRADLPDVEFPIARQYSRDLDYPAHSVVLTPDTELGDMYLIEVSRGCTRGCQFCLAGFVFLPNRERSLERILELAQQGLQYRKRIGLVGAATTDYSRIGELVTRLRELGAQVGVSSLRLDSLTDDLLKALVESGTQTITLAPEAGSERMRQLINKHIDEAQILAAIDKLERWKVAKLKLYYMIGLPTETDDDIAEIIRLTREIKRRMARHRVRSQIIINVGPFIPKAQTPFQHEAMMSVGELKQRMNRLKRELSPQGITVRADSAEWAEVQAVLSRGDRRLAGAMLTMPRNSLGEWRRALAEANLSADFYIRRARKPGETLPWALIRSGVRPELPALAQRGRGRHQGG